MLAGLGVHAPVARLDLQPLEDVVRDPSGEPLHLLVVDRVAGQVGARAGQLDLSHFALLVSQESFRTILSYPGGTICQRPSSKTSLTDPSPRRARPEPPRRRDRARCGGTRVGERRGAAPAGQGPAARAAPAAPGPAARAAPPPWAAPQGLAARPAASPSAAAPAWPAACPAPAPEWRPGSRR